jgi:outer membrane protein assembly factor BamB
MTCSAVGCTARSAFIAALFILAASGCNGDRQALSNGSLPVGSQNTFATSGSDDAWPTFAYDYARSGHNPNARGFTRKSVWQLRLQWQQHLGDSVFASPVAYAGNLIVVTEGDRYVAPGSVVYDLSTTDGHVIWKYALGYQEKMTPTIDHSAGLVFVGKVHKGSSLYALSLLDGSVVWHVDVRGLLRGAPVVTGGSVYLGISGGDPPACTQGGVTAFNESTGAQEWAWYVDPNQHEGGSVWGAIALDGSNLIFGTGNTCQKPVTTANGAVSLSLTGQPLWSMVAVKNSYADSDSGGGVMLGNGLGYFINKNGRFYAVDEQSGNIAWEVDLNPTAPQAAAGGFATPSTDGTTIVEGSGLYQDAKPGSGREFCAIDANRPGEVFPGYHSKLQAMNLSGHVEWSVTMQNRLVGYVAMAQGVGYVGLNKEFVALDLSTGKKLWAYPASNYINASMVVLPTGLYGADESGNVYAFNIPPVQGR